MSRWMAASRQAPIQDRLETQSKEGSLPEPSWRSSAWVTLLIFVIIAHFNPEVLTGSTPIERYFTFFNFLGMLFYGLQVAVIADLAARYRFSWRTIFMVGLIYGIFEEGFAVMTMESPTPPGLGNVLRFAGLNVAWTMYISLFHAVVSVLCTVLIIRLIWPRRISSPFLGRRQYAVILPVVALIYLLFIRFVTTAYVPQASAVAILGGVCLFLGYLARRSNNNNNNNDNSSSTPVPSSSWGKATPYRTYAVWSVGLVILSGLVPYLLAVSIVVGFVLPFLLLACSYLFVRLFERWKSDEPSGGRIRSESTLLIIFSMVVGFWLVFSTFFRTPLSSIFAYAGVGVQLYLAWRSVRRSGPT